MSRPRGICWICGQDSALRADGRVTVHGGQFRAVQRPTGPSRVRVAGTTCKGSGELPAEAQPADPYAELDRLLCQMGRDRTPVIDGRRRMAEHEAFMLNHRVLMAEHEALMRLATPPPSGTLPDPDDGMHHTIAVNHHGYREGDTVPALCGRNLLAQRHVTRDINRPRDDQRRSHAMRTAEDPKACPLCVMVAEQMWPSWAEAYRAAVGAL